MGVQLNISDLRHLTSNSDRILDVLERHENQTMLGNIVRDVRKAVTYAFKEPTVLPPAEKQ